MIRIVQSAILTGCMTAALNADFSYQQNTQVTGGFAANAMKLAGAFSKKAREPNISTVLVKGNRMVSLHPDSAQIIDLDRETFTSVNFSKKSYSVTTFAEMKSRMQEMGDRMQQKTSDKDKPDVQFKASVKETGKTKNIAGVDTREVVLTVEMAGVDKQSGASGGMTMTSSMWMTSDIAGYGEVRDFQGRMAEKLAIIPGQNLGASMGGPEMIKGMSELAKESAKLKGVPVLTVMTMNGALGDPGSTSSAKSDGGQSAAGRGGLSGLAEALARRQRKKNDDASSSSGADSGALIEMTTESSHFSSAPVDPSKFEVPPGFTKIESEMTRGGKH